MELKCIFAQQGELNINNDGLCEIVAFPVGKHDVTVQGTDGMAVPLSVDINEDTFNTIKNNTQMVYRDWDKLTTDFSHTEQTVTSHLRDLIFDPKRGIVYLVKLTDAGIAAAKNKILNYFSPSFRIDPDTQEILMLSQVAGAFTDNPAFQENRLFPIQCMSAKNIYFKNLQRTKQTMTKETEVKKVESAAQAETVKTDAPEVKPTEAVSQVKTEVKAEEPKTVESVDVKVEEPKTETVSDVKAEEPKPIEITDETYRTKHAELKNKIVLAQAAIDKLVQDIPQLKATYAGSLKLKSESMVDDKKTPDELTKVDDDCKAAEANYNNALKNQSETTALHAESVSEMDRLEAEIKEKAPKFYGELHPELQKTSAEEQEDEEEYADLPQGFEKFLRGIFAKLMDERMPTINQMVETKAQAFVKPVQDQLIEVNTLQCKMTDSLKSINDKQKTELLNACLPNNQNIDMPGVKPELTQMKAEIAIGLRKSPEQVRLEATQLKKRLGITFEQAWNKVNNNEF